MLNYFKKFVMDILPSVAATIIGAYIVNHYIAAKPEAPATAAVSAAADPAAKPAPEAGIKAKGMSERTLIERSAAEKAAVTEKPAEKTADLKPADAPVETASIPADSRRHPVAPKAVTKPAPSPAAEAAVTPDEGRDANDLARAAIERLRKEKDKDGAARPQEAARPAEATPRATDVARLPDAPHVTPPSIRPLPPPIMVSNPVTESVDPSNQSSAAAKPDANRLTPPADIPVPIVQVPPLDLRADASMPPPRDEHRSVADDMLSSMKSVFHAVLPK